MTGTIRNIVFGTLIIVLVFGLIAVTVPFNKVAASSAAAVTTPAAPGNFRKTAAANIRLELAYAREQYNLQRLKLAISNDPVLRQGVQLLLDNAAKNGKDASAVQTAFTAYKTAFTSGAAYSDQAEAIAAAHNGFDNDGKVLDAESAKATLKSLGTALKQYKDTVGTAFQALRDSMKTFRLANPRSTQAPPEG
ncbi:MAG: hypothetical protein WCP19_11335 [Chloroflexota bacterium]